MSAGEGVSYTYDGVGPTSLLHLSCPVSLPLRTGASVSTLIKRASYGGRKARSARRRLTKELRVEIRGAVDQDNNGSFLIVGFTDRTILQISGTKETET